MLWFTMAKCTAMRRSCAELLQGCRRWRTWWLFVLWNRRTWLWNHCTPVPDGLFQRRLILQHLREPIPILLAFFLTWCHGFHSVSLLVILSFSSYSISLTSFCFNSISVDFGWFELALFHCSWFHSSFVLIRIIFIDFSFLFSNSTNSTPSNICQLFETTLATLHLVHHWLTLKGVVWRLFKRKSWSKQRHRPTQLHPTPILPPPLHSVFLGDHGKTKVHCARRWSILCIIFLTLNHPGRSYSASKGTQIARRLAAFGRGLSVHHHRLDDVELVGEYFGYWMHSGAFRRLSLQTRRMEIVGGGGEVEGESLWNQCEISPIPPIPLHTSEHAFFSRFSAGNLFYWLPATRGKLRVHLRPHQIGHLDWFNYWRNWYRLAVCWTQSFGASIFGFGCFCLVFFRLLGVNSLFPLFITTCYFISWCLLCWFLLFC